MSTLSIENVGIIYIIVCASPYKNPKLTLKPHSYVMGMYFAIHCFTVMLSLFGDLIQQCFTGDTQAPAY
jgi:hypothetical protein